MKKTTTKTEDQKTSAKRSGKTEEKNTKAKAFNGFKTEGPKPAEEINLDLSGYPEDEKGNKIIPDDIFEENYKYLPNGTKNESGTHIAYNGGRLRMLGAGDPDRDHEIRVAGGKALQATLKERRTLAESIEIALRQKATKENIERYNLPENATQQDVITAAIVTQAGTGNMKAWTALRDTIGEMPVSKQEITADLMTAADRALMEKLQRRLDDQ